MGNLVTKFFGQALTGQGIKNVYTDVMKEAETVYLLKGAHGFHISALLQKLGNYYYDKGADIDYFYDPLFDNTLEATFVKAPYNTLFLQATNPAVEPTLIGERDHIISLDDCVDAQQLASNTELATLIQTKQTYYAQCFNALANAIKIHDDWEIETQKHMNWRGLDAQYEELVTNLFGQQKQAKPSTLTHRLLGTLTPAGARDTLQSITQQLETRLFIKGYPGTGKSSMMKKLAQEATNRGFDVQLVWCGLDANSIDMVILPELKFCIFDSTEPRVYFPDENRPGDSIFDIAKHCHPTEIEEENIKEIVTRYKAAIAEATHFIKLYAQQERQIREATDNALNIDLFENRTAGLFKLT